MNLLHDDDTTNLEDELRAVLRRRSAGLDLDQPDWQELIEQPDSTVYSLPTDDARSGEETRVWRHRPKPVFIAAAAVAVVLAGGLAVERTTADDPTELTEAPASFSAAAPTDADFDARSAPSVWTSDLDDPEAATAAYLAATGVAPELAELATSPDLPDTPGLPTISLLENSDGLAVVEWSALDGEVSRTGTVYLRTSVVEEAESTVRSTWSVVGSAVDSVALADVAYDGSQLSFTVTKTADVGGPLAVSVWSNGEQVAVDGDAVRAGAGSNGEAVGAGAATADDAVSAGAAAEPQVDSTSAQVVDIADAAGSHVPLTAVVDEASNVVIRVQQLVGGVPESVTEMAVTLPGADGTAGTDVAGAADAEADVDASTGDAGAEAGADAAADAEADVDASAGDAAGDVLDDAGDAVDDVVDGTEVPLPGGGEVTTPSIPTTLPDLTVPTTAPGGPSLPTP